MIDIQNNTLLLVDSEDSGLKINKDNQNDTKTLSLQVDDTGLNVYNNNSNYAKILYLMAGRSRLSMSDNGEDKNNFRLLNLTVGGSDVILSNAKDNYNTLLLHAGRSELQIIDDEEKSDRSLSLRVGQSDLIIKDNGQNQSLKFSITDEITAEDCVSMEIDNKNGVLISGKLKADTLILANKKSINSSSLEEGTQAWDSISKKPCWWNGTQWVDVIGNILT